MAVNNLLFNLNKILAVSLIRSVVYDEKLMTTIDHLVIICHRHIVLVSIVCLTCLSSSSQNYTVGKANYIAKER